MRLKFIACKYTVFIPFRILARNIFSFLSTKTNQFAISEINLMRTKRTSSSVKSSPNSSRASSILSVVDSLK